MPLACLGSPFTSQAKPDASGGNIQPHETFLMSTSEIIVTIIILLLRGDHLKISSLRTIFLETLEIKFGFLGGKYQFVILSGTVITSTHQRED
jgi:hypothetical protein